jgi:hypothetical protein
VADEAGLAVGSVTEEDSSCKETAVWSPLAAIETVRKQVRA